MKFFSLLFSVFFLFGCTSEKIEEKNMETKSPIAEEKIVKSEKDDTDDFTYFVTRIVDGDTLWVRIDGIDKKIRLVGINTPETEKEFTPVECYADEAEDRLKEILRGKKVSLLTNKKGDDEDQYGRLLRYVFVDGKDVNAQLIEEGYAFAFRRYPHDRMSFYVEKETEAKQEKRGMWNPENCSYW